MRLIGMVAAASLAASLAWAQMPPAATLGALSKQVVPAIAALPMIAKPARRVNLLVDTGFFRNESLAPVDKAAMFEALRGELRGALGDKALILCRADCAADTAGAQGADYRLVGKVTSPLPGQTEATFELVDLASGESAWRAAYPVRPEALSAPKP
jgi:hypothetical protein